MTTQQQSLWDEGLENTYEDRKEDTCDNRLIDLVNTDFVVLGIQDKNVGKYDAYVFTILKARDGKEETVYSSSAVINDQLEKMDERGQFPCFARIIKTKNYYTFVPAA